MEKYLATVIMAIFLFVSIEIVYFTNKENKIRNQLKKQVESFTQERGTSWMDAKGIPDTIFFISFSNDTTYYKRIKK